MTLKGESITLSLGAADKAMLEAIALHHGCTWGDKPNISALLKEIARGELVVYSSNDEIALSSSLENGRAAINKVHQGLKELSAILSKSVDDCIDYDVCAPSKPSRQEEICRELAAKHKCNRHFFSFTSRKDEVTLPILHSEYFPYLDKTLYFYRDDVSFNPSDLT